MPGFTERREECQGRCMVQTKCFNGVKLLKFTCIIRGPSIILNLDGCLGLWSLLKTAH